MGLNTGALNATKASAKKLKKTIKETEAKKKALFTTQKSSKR